MDNLLCINSPFTDPYMNLAAEEYLLKHFDADIFMLYINRASVIVGKHQNTLSEINIEDIKQKNIAVVRRLSGGGTVYHDLGNLNFVWIVQGEKNKPVNFNKYMNDIYLFLKSLNINVSQTKNNDLAIDGKKISGNAEHIFKQRLIHHGTLLYNTNLQDLNNAISGNAAFYSTKAVQSKRANVTNIINFMNKPVTIKAFRNALFHYIKNKYVQSIDYQFDERDLSAIRNLAARKYTTWEWNFAYSPKYIFEKDLTQAGEKISVRFKVQKGIITDFRIKTKFLDEYELNTLAKSINGSKHHRDELNKIFEKSFFKQLKKKMKIDDLFILFF